MPSKPLLINNSLTVTFPPNKDIRMLSAVIEKLVRTKDTSFTQPTLLPVPDEMDPGIPRIVFGTTHNYSQLVISQSTISLNMMYSADYQKNFALCEEYIKKHGQLLYLLVDKVVKQKAYFTGLSSVARIDMKENDTQIIQHIADQQFSKIDTKNLFDIDLKFTHTIGNKYFRNLQIQNFRMWESETVPQSITAFPSSTAKHRGIQFLVDFNDRYSFNEVPKYSTSWPKCSNIIRESFAHLNNDIVRICK